MPKKTNYNGGLIQLILLIIIFILIISYFGINIRKIIQSDTGKDNFGFIWNILQQIWGYIVLIWDKYLSGPVGFIWNGLFVDIIWKNLVQMINQARQY